MTHGSHDLDEIWINQRVGDFEHSHLMCGMALPFTLLTVLRGIKAQTPKGVHFVGAFTIALPHKVLLPGALDY